MGSRYHPDTVIGGWTLMHLLDRGGNSEVWRATRGAEQVALKIPFVKNPDAEPYKRFQSEVQILLSIGNQKGILPLLESEVPSRPSRAQPAWLATPVATPIREALGEAPTIDEVVEALAEIADTLSVLAEKDIYHRDLKPGNLFHFEGDWVVGDFGLADFPEKEALTAEHRRMGPLFFLAPEMMSAPHVADGGRLTSTHWPRVCGSWRRVRTIRHKVNCGATFKVCD